MKKHILLVGGSRDGLNIFIEAINATLVPYKCTWAQNGQQAISQLHYITPDFVFLDMDMPGMKGLETLREIMQLPNAGGYKVAMYSNGLDSTSAAKAIMLGAAYCIHKTDTIAELANILGQLLLEKVTA